VVKKIWNRGKAALEKGRERELQHFKFRIKKG